MAKKKTKANRKQNISFTIAAGFLAILILGSVALFIVTSLLHGKTSSEFTKSLYPVKYEYYVEAASKEFDVDVCLIYGVIRTESGFNPDAVSHAGAIGLMQIMPETFTWLQNYRSDFMPEKILDSKELYKPNVNIEYGTYMLRYLLDHYNGDTSLVICAYNAGYGNVDSWLEDGTIPKSGVTSDDIPFTETANYLNRVTEAMNMYRTLYYDEIDYYSSVSSDAVSSEADDSENLNSDNDTSAADEEFTSSDEEYSPAEEDSEREYQEYYPEIEDGYADDEYAEEW